MPRRRRDAPPAAQRSERAQPSFKLAWRAGHAYVAWTENRRSKRKALGTTDEVEARKLLDLFVTAPPAQPTIALILDHYRADRAAAGVAALATLDHSIAPLKAHYGHLEPRDLRLGAKAIEAYRVWRGTWLAVRGRLKGRQPRPIAPSTGRRELGVLRAALQLAARDGWIDKAPAIALPPEGEPRERWLTRDEARCLLEACRAPHVRLFILLGLHTLARAGAILELTWDRVDLENGRIDFRRPGRSRRSKGRAVVRINDVLRPALEMARSIAGDGRAGPVIEHAGRPVGSVKRGIAAAARRAGLDPARAAGVAPAKPDGRSRITPHVFRHTGITWLMQAGADPWKVAGMAGHSSPAMIWRVYGHHHPDYQVREAKLLEG